MTTTEIYIGLVLLFGLATALLYLDKVKMDMYIEKYTENRK